MDRERFTVRGIVRSREEHRGLKGLQVEARDADLLVDDKLGSAVTDAEGTFKIDYRREDFQELFEGEPDLYLVVRAQDGRLLHSTRARIRFNARREEQFLIELPADVLGQTPAERVVIGGLRVSARVFDQVGPQDLIALARAYRGAKLNEGRLALFASLSPALVDCLIPREEARETVMCLTPEVMFIEGALHHLKAPQHLYDQLDSVLYSPPPNARSHLTDHFRIFYTPWSGAEDAWESTSGTVLASDSPAVTVHLFSEDQNVIGETEEGIGVPTYVQKAAIWLEYAFDRYTRLYRMRDPRIGGERVEVTFIYLEGPVTGFGGKGNMWIANSLDDALLASTCVHELFHCVQYRYLPSPGNTPLEAWEPFMLEGLPRLIEDTVNDGLNAWIADASSFFSHGNVNKSLPELRYKGAVFWKYVTEQHSTQVTPAFEPAIGIDAIRTACELAEALGVADITVPIALRTHARTPYWGTFRDFVYLPPGNAELSTNETTFGNWLAANYLQCLRHSELDRRFTYLEASEGLPEGWGLSCVFPTSRDQLAQSQALILEHETVSWAAQYHEVEILEGVDTVRIAFGARADLPNPLTQLLLIADDDIVRDVIRFEGDFTKTINASGLKRIIIVPAARELVPAARETEPARGAYSIRVEAIEATSDVMITRWNSRRGEEHEIDPIGWSWHWISPDIWVDNDDDGEGNNSVHFEWSNPLGGSNHLYVRLRNKGTARAENVSVRFYYQDASATLRDDCWQPVIEGEGETIAQLSGLALDPGEEFTDFVSWWLPRPMGPEDEISDHFCIKAEVTSPGDVNTDNKMTLSNLAVVEPPDASVDDRRSLDFRLWGDWFDVNKSDQGPRMVETYLIPRNEPAVWLNRRDLMSVHSIRVQDILSDVETVAGMETPPWAGAARAQSGRQARSKLPAASRLYHLRLAGEEYRTTSSHSPGLHYPVEWALPPMAEQGQWVPARLDPETLPPGVSDLPTITLVQVIDGRVTGGVTYVIKRGN